MKFLIIKVGQNGFSAFKAIKIGMTKENSNTLIFDKNQEAACPVTMELKNSYLKKLYFKLVFLHYILVFIKLQLFWEGHKNVRNRPYGFEIYLVNVKTMRKIAQIFVAFLEKLNFIILVKNNIKNTSAWGEDHNQVTIFFLIFGILI